MARKVFISILGAGYYESCYYVHEYGHRPSHPTRFIQEAMIDYFGVRSWRKKNEGIGYIFLTDKAKTQNWNVPNQKRFNQKAQKEEEYVGLEALVGKCVETAGIPDGMNKEQLWKIFGIIYDKLQEDDELYIDLTHAFRSLPMLLLVLCNYAKFLKKVKVKAITYGNYEARNIDTNEAPIVDLLPLSQLQDWTFAAANFIENGDVSRLVKLSNSDYVKKMETFINQMRFCRGREIYDPKSLYEAGVITEEEKETLPKVLPPILEKINDSVPRNKFAQEQNAWNCIYAAEWCYKMKQYQAAVTMLQEGVVTFLCEYCGYPVHEEKFRELISASFEKVKRGQFNFKTDKNGNLKFDEKDVNETIEKTNLNKKSPLLEFYEKLREIRNDFNHAGMLNNTKKWTEKDIDNVINGIKKALRLY